MTVAAKMEALVGVVNDGKSIAVATGFAGAREQVRDSELMARMSMGPRELQQYQAWKDGVFMPGFDWVHNRDNVPGGVNSQRRFAESAQAMATIFNVKQVAPENAAWLYKHMSYAIPLVKAHIRVARAEKHMRRGGGTEGANWMELAEAETARKAVTVSTKRVSEVRARLRKLEASLNRSMDVIQARKHALQAKLLNSKATRSTRGV